MNSFHVLKKNSSWLEFVFAYLSKIPMSRLHLFVSSAPNDSLIVENIFLFAISIAHINRIACQSKLVPINNNQQNSTSIPRIEQHYKRLWNWIRVEGIVDSG